MKVETEEQDLKGLRPITPNVVPRIVLRQRRRKGMSGDDLSNAAMTLRSEMSPRVVGHNAAKEVQLRKKVGMWFTEQNMVINKLNKGQNLFYRTLLRVDKDKKRFAKENNERRQMEARRLSHRSMTAELWKQDMDKNLISEEKPKTAPENSAEDKGQGKEHSEGGTVLLSNISVDNFREPKLYITGHSRNDKHVDTKDTGAKEFHGEKSPSSTSKLDQNMTSGDLNKKTETCSESSNLAVTPHNIATKEFSVNQINIDMKQNDKTNTQDNYFDEADVEKNKLVTVKSNQGSEHGDEPKDIGNNTSDKNTKRVLEIKNEEGQLRNEQTSVINTSVMSSTPHLQDSTTYKSHKSVPGENEHENRKFTALPALKEARFAPVGRNTSRNEEKTENDDNFDEVIQRVKDINTPRTEIKVPQDNLSDCTEQNVKTHQFSPQMICTPYNRDAPTNVSSKPSRKKKKSTSAPSDMTATLEYNKLRIARAEKEILKIDEPCINHRRNSDGMIIPVPEIPFKRKEFKVPDHRERRMRKKLLDSQKAADRIQRERLEKFYEKVDKDVGKKRRHILVPITAEEVNTEETKKPVVDPGQSLRHLIMAFRQDTLDPDLDPNSSEALTRCHYIRLHSPKSARTKEIARRRRISSWAAPSASSAF